MARNKNPIKDRKCDDCNTDIHVNDKVLSCASCESSFLIGCVGVKSAEFGQMKSKLDWTCSVKCKYAHTQKTQQSKGEKTNGDMPSNPSNYDLLKEIREIKESQSFIGDKYDQLVCKFDEISSKFEEMNNRISQLEKENTKLKTQVNKQTSERTKNGQIDLNNNIIVSGVPNSIENIGEAFNKIANAVSVDYDVNSNVASIERLFTPKPDANGVAGNKKVLDKIPILVKFLSESGKAKFMESVKINKGVFTAAECEISNDDAKVFIKDQISSYNMQLIKEAKKLKLNGMVKFVWFQNGNVLVRQGETTKIIKIKSQDDLSKIN